MIDTVSKRAKKRNKGVVGSEEVDWRFARDQLLPGVSHLES